MNLLEECIKSDKMISANCLFRCHENFGNCMCNMNNGKEYVSRLSVFSFDPTLFQEIKELSFKKPTLVQKCLAKSLKDVKEIECEAERKNRETGKKRLTTKCKIIKINPEPEYQDRALRAFFSGKTIGLNEETSTEPTQTLIQTENPKQPVENFNQDQNRASYLAPQRLVSSAGVSTKGGKYLPVENAVGIFSIALLVFGSICAILLWKLRKSKKSRRAVRL